MINDNSALRQVRKLEKWQGLPLTNKVEQYELCRPLR